MPPPQGTPDPQRSNQVKIDAHGPCVIWRFEPEAPAVSRRPDVHDMRVIFREILTGLQAPSGPLDEGERQLFTAKPGDS